MIAATLALLTGVLLLQCLPALPPGYCYIAIPVAVYFLRRPAARLPALLLLGFFWAAFRAEMALWPVLDPQLEGRTVLVQGSIAGLVTQVSSSDLRFPFRVERIRAGGSWRDFNARVRLSWYRSRQQPASGQRWQLAVRMKRPHGYANPGGFDYERWLFQQRIRATGYVRKDSRNRRLGGSGLPWGAGIRQRLADHFSELNPDTTGLALVRALTIGDRSAVSPAQWEVLRATGTSHLMAISGLHVSLVAGLVFWLVKWLWSHTATLAERVPASKAAALAALLSALGYGLLAGMGIPTRRALIMLAVAMLAVVAGRRSRPGHVLCLAVIAVLVIDPLAVLSAGWWLSFWAVTLIVYTTCGRHGRQAVWHRVTRVHMVLAVSLLPLSLTLFQQASLVAPLANVIAVPWVGLFVVPVSLAATLLLSLSETAGNLLLNLAAWLIAVLWPLLESLGELDGALLQQHRPLTWTLIPALAGILLLFAPRGIPGRWTGALLLLPMLTVRPPGPDAGEAWVTLLDVGQGLATVVRTGNHVLVYDAGPRYSPGFDTGSRVVVPFLYSQGIARIDKLIVSHGDNDHIGGVPSLLREFTVSEVLTGVTADLHLGATSRCERGNRWEWDGVEFSVLHPQPGRQRQGNNASCVIRVRSRGGQRILLTGDIEAGPERRLLLDSREQLRAEVLTVPHHGSLTSSTAEFVDAVHPDFALFPVGYGNRYRFPRDTVVARYRALGSLLYDTARHGALTVRLSADGRDIEIVPYRCAKPRYWRMRPPEDCPHGNGLAVAANKV
ncbi:MAG: DNA internalization-related competence protein ComEC/Rec2 [Gammaproteobacteria bacterium]|jgi:competence protein ComEC